MVIFALSCVELYRIWGGEGFPGLKSGVEELSNTALSGILGDGDLGYEVASAAREVIETASKETFNDARKLLKRI